MDSPSASTSCAESQEVPLFSGYEGTMTDVTIQEALKLLGLNAIIAPQCSFERSARKVSKTQFQKWKSFQLKLADVGVKSLQPFPEDYIVENGRRFYRIQVAVDIDPDDEGFTEDMSMETVGECIRTKNAIKGKKILSGGPAPVKEKVSAVVAKTPSSKKRRIPPANPSKKVKGFLNYIANIVAVAMLHAVRVLLRHRVRLLLVIVLIVTGPSVPRWFAQHAPKRWNSHCYYQW